MKKIAVCNQKGGVGKTATAINLTAGLSLAEKNVLLIDIDPQANSTSGLGVDYKTLEKSIYDCLYEPDLVRETILKTKWPRISIVPSTTDLAGAEIELVDKDDREGKLKKVLSLIDFDYDFGIIDCPPSLGLLTVNALVACDSVIIPIQCEYYALEGLEKLLKTLKAVKNGLNSNLVIEGILLTMYDARLNLAKDVVEDIQAHFPEVVFKTVIPRSVRIAESPSYGNSVIHYSIVSSGAQAYLNLTRELLNHA
ncbi:chromosome partitioning protein ParA [candidate division WOR_3 bacterium SM23_42]|uniref:Chromosome partitioning protein ParA n=1 Tax=candidate division WOR_3 bacterium SM23_42 TaxID=1703779 RepID=A0A0S8FWM1_UNCW3|nr:MAG: chromosome partitioning protein ParA [candidate division WOR_3 bacterium SM23_42]